MNILIDSFPYSLTLDDSQDYSANVEIYHNPGWMGPTSPEIEASRIQGVKDSWVGANDRRSKAAADMSARHPMRRATELSITHKANIGLGMMGNQNKLGKRGGNQHTKKKQLAESAK